MNRKHPRPALFEWLFLDLADCRAAARAVRIVDIGRSVPGARVGGRTVTPTLQLSPKQASDGEFVLRGRLEDDPDGELQRRAKRRRPVTAGEGGPVRPNTRPRAIPKRGG